MNPRFADLKKIPKEPAARMLAVANARLKAPLKAPASAALPVVLEELESQGALIDMLRLLSVALPPRERTWWACLAARDLLGPGATKVPAPLLAAEQWVFKPGDDTRNATRAALDAADSDDDTTLCATCVIFCDGMLGTGDLAKLPGPPGASQAAAFGMNLLALSRVGGDFPSMANRFIDRALDIARGGNGRLAETATSAGGAA
ncbi:hypothetical protein RNZ50_21245 [Paracoccaceae bacterium Fryx2]|nr:hypothetical protein [Paracoccaceae bacterium Fryx2]